MPLAGNSVVTDAAPPLPTERGSSMHWRIALLSGIGLELVILYAPTFRWLIDRWTRSVWDHAHGLFIPPLVGWLIWQELRRHPQLRADAGSALGFLLLVPALAINALDAGMHTQLLSALSIIVALPGLSLLFLGTRRTKAIIFPLAFCVFAVPIPLAMTESAHLVLRHVAATGTAAALPYLGVTVFLDGTSLHLTNTTLQVVDACSGFSTLYAAIALAVLTAYSTTSGKRRLLVLTTAAPIAIASNVLRVILLALLILWRGPEVLHTPLHPMTGMLTFAISLPLIFWLGGPTGRRQSA